MGGLDRISTVVKGDQGPRRRIALILDGGDTCRVAALDSGPKGMDMVRLFNALGTDAMTSHWEFTLGSARVNELIEKPVNPAFLGANIFDVEWDEAGLRRYLASSSATGTAEIGVTGQAFP